MQFDFKKFKTIFFHYFMGLSALAMFIAIGVYAYLGSFSRYLSDDYCEAVSTRHSIIGGVLERYEDGSWRAANRYSNLLFVGFSELLGENSMPITTTTMIMLWSVGLCWSVYEFRKLFKFNWSFQTDCFLGLTLGFFILLQIPNLFQTIYWRSSMMTHFAPLVFGSFLFAFCMKQARSSKNEHNPPLRAAPLFLVAKQSPTLVYFIIFFTTFMIAGFSEPPVATMITALGLILVALWVWGSPAVKQKISPLAIFAFTGALFGLMVMVFSPAMTNMIDNSDPSLFELLRDSFLFSFIFIQYSFKELPLPNLLSAFIPFLVIWSYKQLNPIELSQTKKRFLWFIIIASPILMWILIAAGFSPSVYGQGYPIERMRFLARSIMTATFMFEGAMFGLLFQNINLKMKSVWIRWGVGVLFLLIGFAYPLRAALTVYQKNINEYQTRAEMWDLRNEYIIRHAQLGEREIVAPGYSGIYNIKELDDNPKHWVNSCAAKFYGVDSIRAVSIPDEFILEYLSE